MLSDVVGQTDAVRVLRRVQTQELTTPLLLVGCEGVGKRFSVLQLVKELFCVESKSSQCSCFACKQVQAETHSDLTLVRSEDGKDIGVDQIRALLSEVDFYPSSSPFRVFLIETADRLTTAAANALLKTLEEPPKTARFFLIAEEASRVIPTIRSRCGYIQYHNLPESFVLSKLSSLESNPTKALTYTRMSEGSLGTAIQYWGSNKADFRDRVLKILEAGVKRDLWGMFSTLETLDKELPLVLKIIDQLVHDLVMIQHNPQRLIHIDVADRVILVSRDMKPDQLRALSEGARYLLGKIRFPLNFGFHVRALLADVYLRG